MAKARMVQAKALFDAYGFRPMILDHYANAVFVGLEGRSGDREKAAAGLAAAAPVVLALERIAAKGQVLAEAVALADCHLGPMLRAFAASAEGATLLAACPALNARRQMLEDRPSLRLAGLP
jgi:glutathione S-transferase